VPAQHHQLGAQPHAGVRGVAAQIEFESDI